MSAAPGMGAMCVCMTTRRRDSGDISMCLTTNACFNARCPEASVWTVGMYTGFNGSSTFSVVHCGGDVEFTDGEVEHGD